MTVTTTTMPHDPPDIAGPATTHRTAGLSARPPRPVSPEARDALADALAAGDLVHDAREQMTVHADLRRRAVLRASRAGASHRRIAAALGVSPGNVGQLVEQARVREAARRR